MLLTHHDPVLDLLIQLVLVEFFEELHLCHTVLQILLIMWIINKYSTTADWLLVFLFLVHLFINKAITVYPMRILNILVFQDLLLTVIDHKGATMLVLEVITIKMGKITHLVVINKVRCLVEVSLISVREASVKLLSLVLQMLLLLKLLLIVIF